MITKGQGLGPGDFVGHGTSKFIYRAVGGLYTTLTRGRVCVLDHANAGGGGTGINPGDPTSVFANVIVPAAAGDRRRVAGLLSDDVLTNGKEGLFLLDGIGYALCSANVAAGALLTVATANTSNERGTLLTATTGDPILAQCLATTNGGTTAVPILAPVMWFGRNGPNAGKV